MERGRRRTPRWWMMRSFLILLVVVGITELAIDVVLLRFTELGWIAQTLANVAALVAICAVVLWLTVVRQLLTGLEERNRRFARSEEHLRAQSESFELNGQIHRALEMAVTESDVMTVSRHAMASALPGRCAEILMADSSDAHLAVAMATADGGPGCSVSTPGECPAVRVGHVLAFRSSTDIDACPRLRDREGGPTSAVCVPISVLGHAAGVLHVTAVRPIDDQALDRLRDLGAAVGRRLTLVRALTDSQRKAASDPLTGLMNRRSLEDRIAVMDRGRRAYAVVTLDLDHFKAINDTHGHAAGDQALRLFARALQEVARGGDLVARYGGEEFVIVLPDASSSAATSLAERLRVHLLELLSTGTVPAYTVSAGVADSSTGGQFNEILAIADACLLRAKANGRNRVEVAAAEAAS